MSASADSSRERYAAVVKALLREPGVTQSNKKGFGSTALWTNGKIFALLSSKDEFVVKLSRPRVDVLVAAGEGKRFEPGPGRVMKEWFVVGTKGEEKWLALAKEAMKGCEFEMLSNHGQSLETISNRVRVVFQFRVVARAESALSIAMLDSLVFPYPPGQYR